MKNIKNIRITFLFIFCFSFINFVQAQIITAENKQNIHITSTNDSFTTAPSPINYLEVQRGITYPISCRELGIEGKVIMKILVCEKGNAKQIVFVESLHPDLKLACQERVKDLKFKPARNQEGEAVESWVVIPFHFRLSI